MSSVKPQLASWESRLLAGALDALALGVATALLIAIFEAAGANNMAVAPLLPVGYVAYHYYSVFYPRLSLGKTIMGLAVISVRNNGEVTKTQAALRPAMRLVMFVCALVAGVVASTPWISVSAVVVEISLVAITPWRQSIADFLVGTIVIRAPVPQPHRAPAVPMFSSRDEEFGPRP